VGGGVQLLLVASPSGMREKAVLMLLPLVGLLQQLLGMLAAGLEFHVSLTSA
jgi:hypothetical protein